MKRLLLQTTWGGMVISGLLIICTTNTWAACIAKNDCAELGYKYSAAECSGEGLTCVFDPTRYNCANPCTYTVTASTCSSQCLNAGAKSCKRGNTTYYESCGTSRCSSGQTCNNGACKNPTPSAPTSGLCCGASECGYSGASHPDDSNCKRTSGESCYSRCMRYYPDCDDMQASCQASGGSSRFLGCSSLDDYFGIHATFSCE